MSLDVTNDKNPDENSSEILQPIFETTEAVKHPPIISMRAPTPPTR
jgi:hypothetical protein